MTDDVRDNTWTTLPNLRSSRITGFHKLPLVDRVALVAAWAALSPHEQAMLTYEGLSLERADQMIENVIGLYALPLGVATNFQINGQDYLIPMVVEEPSVVAACSNAARLVREGGGFHTSSDEPLMIGQIQILDVDNVYAAAGRVWEQREALIEAANDSTSSIVRRGGGVRDLELHPLMQTSAGPMLIVHIVMDTRDAMGANAVNTMAEKTAPLIEELTGGRVYLRILSNLADRRLARASCRVPQASLATDGYSGAEVVRGIALASAFAEADPYRAATHNKGVMNGIDAVVIATGNDWRAIEAGAHSFAARSGRYTALTRWDADANGDLVGSIELPLAVGLVGGATKVHPGAQAAVKMLGVTTARELAAVIASVGLAQNLAAIRALATEGIQRGHMALHARQVAAAAGANGEQIEQLAARMVSEKNIKVDRAAEILKELRANG